MNGQVSIPTGDTMWEVLKTIAGELHAAGYWREVDERRTDGYIALMGAFRRMAEDAAKQRARPTFASGRELELSFLHSIVEDANKPMQERMEAAHLRLMHNSEEK